ncbi:MAG: hypothetical protein HDS42_01240 [Bacteroides sp.]|nr:hypothetical protein [Bacteroides sp.]
MKEEYINFPSNVEITTDAFGMANRIFNMSFLNENNIDSSWVGIKDDASYSRNVNLFRFSIGKDDSPSMSEMTKDSSMGVIVRFSDMMKS